MPYGSVYREDLFKDQVVLITGGGSGMGRCTAHELASLGAHVVLVGRSESKLQQVQAEIAADGGAASAHACDIRDEAAVIDTINKVLKAQGRIDGLVNNAGGQYRSKLEDISTKGFEAVFRTNLLGGFIFMREVYNRWMRDHGGSIVNVIIDMWNGMPNFGHAAAARGGMLALSQTAAAEWARSGVRVNALAPGVIETSGLDSYPQQVYDDTVKQIMKVPMSRFGTESEVAAAIVYLLSPASTYVTGACLRVDGGGPNARQTLDLQTPVRMPRFDGFHRAGPRRA
ncbi:MAG: SDR family oxidoreductase [Burkholderiales bacterium]